MSTEAQEHWRMLRDLEGRESELTAWEREFVDSLTNRIENGKRLTDSQVDKLTELWGRIT